MTLLFIPAGAGGAVTTAFTPMSSQYQVPLVLDVNLVSLTVAEGSGSTQAHLLFLDYYFFHLYFPEPVRAVCTQCLLFGYRVCFSLCVCDFILF